MKIKCAYCGKVTEKSTGHYNRAIKLGAGLYCDRRCASNGHKTNETPEEKKSIKSWYDLLLRMSMTDDERELDEFQNMVYFQWDYTNNPDKYRKRRQDRMEYHVEYCRQPEYKEWKRRYDENYRARKDYGDWWEVAIALKNLDKEIDYRESKRQNKIYNKSTSRRKRSWQKQLKQSVKNLRQLI